MTEDAIIQVQGVQHVFRERAAIDNVSLTIRRGELFGIIGPDGAGKTTLLRMMAGVLNPNNGQITVNAFDTVQQAEQVKACLGYMPQQFGLYGDLSVDENLHFAADVYGIRGAGRRQRFTELYEFTQLTSFKKRRAQFLSGGMKKKLALACALIHQPAILLLDEPTTGVDPVTRRNFWDLLSGLHTAGTTTIVSTPYMDEAERCNRVALLYQGHVLACDTPSRIKAMIPGKVLALRGSNIHSSQALLQDLPFLLDVQVYGDQLNLIVDDDSAEARLAIRERLTGNGVTLGELESVPMRMEEAFIFLVNQERKENAA